MERKSCFWSGIYCYYIFRLFINENEKLYSTLSVVAYIILFCEIWGLSNAGEGLGYDMGFGYRMEMASIIFLSRFLYKKRTKVYLFLSFLCILLAIIYGARANIVGYGFFILVYFLWVRKVNSKMIFLSLFIIIAGLLASSRSFLIYLYDLFTTVGISSRTLYKMIFSDNAFASPSRTKLIWPVLIDALKKMPIYKMYGAYGDRSL